MKKRLLYTILLFAVTLPLCHAQNPILWGMADMGGAKDSGIIFNYNVITSTETNLYSFGSSTDGRYPYGSFIRATNGLLYGTTNEGGAYGNNYGNGGIILSYNTTTNTETDIHDFGNGKDAIRPGYGHLLQASNGLLYGLSEWGGLNDEGTLYSYNISTGKDTVLYNFNTGSIFGYEPTESLIQVNDSLLLGTTPYGGVNSVGIIFSYNILTGTLSDLYDFGNSTDGAYPSSLILGSDGLIYGVTTAGGTYGGSYGYGVIFSYDISTGKETVLHNFSGGTTDGFNAQAPPMQATDSLIYGTTASGGVNNSGIIFSYNIATGTETDLHDFGTGTDGKTPHGTLFQASDGLFYGMTMFGGTNNVGIIYNFNSSTGAEADIHDFGNGNDGQEPTGDLIEVDSVNIFATPVFPKICEGDSVVLAASGATTYTWTPSTALSATTGDSVVANPTVTTTYTITGATGGHKNTITVIVTVIPSPAIMVNTPLPFCKGDSAMLIAKGGTTYTWAPATGLSATTGDSVVANPTVTTVYTITGTSGSCISTLKDTVKIIITPPLIIKPQDTSICDGQSVTLNAQLSGSDYVWSPSLTLSSGTSDTVIATTTVTTVYTLTGMDSLGCSVSGIDTVTINHGPSKPTIAKQGDILTSSATQGNQWVRNDTVLLGATNQTYTAIIAGYYQVIAKNPVNGCSTESDSIMVEGINQLSAISNQLSIYPNPTSGEIIVNISSSVGEVKDWNLRITDVLGRAVYSKLSLNYNNDIDLSKLPNGVYFVTVINKMGEAAVPVVKQN
jgi:uncharacterized repeat protein (TIGR03803 family)